MYGMVLDRLRCVSMEIEMNFKFRISRRGHAWAHTDGSSSIALVDAHYLGVLIIDGHSGAIFFLITIDPKNIRFSIIFRHEN